MKPKTKPNMTRTLVKEYFEKCEKEGRRPTIRETAKAIKIVSTNTVLYHMRKLGIKPRDKKYNSKYGNNLVVLRNKVIDILGGKCSKCGFQDIRALQIDHINGDGAAQRKEYGGNRGMYITMISELESGKTGKYQLLCANCNWIKRYENNENSNPIVGHAKWSDKI